MNNSYENLKKRIEKRHGEVKKGLIDKHWDAFQWASNNTKQIAAGALGSLLLLAAPSPQGISAGENTENRQFVELPENVFMLSDLKEYLPNKIGELLPAQEKKISEILSNYYGFTVVPEIDGKRLMHTYGYIGAEQHLKRYPGDTMEDHFTVQSDEQMFYSSGMAPGRGAFGYFSNSKSEMTREDIEREKYYIAVQTFLAQGYVARTREYVDFFKFRKMLVVNPNTGRAVVAVIGDAGPAVWTKKHLGGSPEVMKHLERVDGKAKGPVLYFFIEDPENKIPLGPIDPIRKEGIAKI